MSTGYRYRRAIDGQHIRLLQFDGYSDSTFHCTLKEYPFNPSSYESWDFSSICALSYCWGTEEATEMILIGNESFMVRPNLLEALKSILLYTRNRCGDKPCFFWIDAICINQRDTEERAAQLDLMSLIYSNMQVLIWLGPEEYGSDSVMNVFKWMEVRRIGEIQELFHSKVSWRHFLWKRKGKRAYAEALSQMTHIATSGTGLSQDNLLAFERLLESATNEFTFARCGEDEHMLSKEHPWWEAMIRLLTNPWFSRVWTLQEVVLAQDAIVMCGLRSVRWAIFKDCRAAFLRQIELYGMEAAARVRGCSINLPMLSDLIGSSAFYNASFSKDLDINVLRNLFLFGVSFIATNPKDYLYGFLALAGSDVRSKVRKEYADSYSVARVFVQAVELCSQAWVGEAIEKGQEFWLQLCYKRLHECESEMAGLPSWCLDFRSNAQNADRSISGLDDESLSDEDNRVSERSDARWACKGITVQYPELMITGLHLDTIKHSSSLPSNCSDYLDKGPWARKLMCQQAYEWVSQIVQSLADDVVSEWLAKYFHPGDLSLELSFDHSALGHQQKEVMGVWKAVVGVSQLDDIYGEEPIFRRLGMSKQLYEALMGYVAAVLLRNMGRYFFSTSDGRLGRSMQPCKAGQILCYFPRGRYFHILEPFHDLTPSQQADASIQQYKHIGVALVHGLGGDGLDSLPYSDDHLQEFHIV